MNNPAQWHQEIVVKPNEELPPASKANNAVSGTGGGSDQKKASGGGGGGGTVVRPPKDQPIHCPRCNSTNTKFCYYNNYSLTQPRYFCKGCRRYWTAGGSLRNIPVGGGSRKNKRSSSLAGAPSGAVGAKKLFVHPSLQNPNNANIHQLESSAGHDLNLSFPNHHQDFRSIPDFIQLPNTTPSSQSAAASSHLSALELLTGMTSRGVGLGGGGGGGFGNNFMPVSDPDSVYSSSSFASFMHDFKPPTLNFSLDHGLGIGPTSSGVFNSTTTQHHHDQVTADGVGGRGLVSSPYDDLKSQQAEADHNRGHGVSTGYWSGGMLGGGGCGSDW